jgi:hypothetical protein
MGFNCCSKAFMMTLEVPNPGISERFTYQLRTSWVRKDPKWLYNWVTSGLTESQVIGVPPEGLLFFTLEAAIFGGNFEPCSNGRPKSCPYRRLGQAVTFLSDSRLTWANLPSNAHCVNFGWQTGQLMQAHQQLSKREGTVSSQSKMIIVWFGWWYLTGGGALMVWSDPPINSRVVYKARDTWTLAHCKLLQPSASRWLYDALCLEFFTSPSFFRISVSAQVILLQAYGPTDLLRTFHVNFGTCPIRATSNDFDPRIQLPSSRAMVPLKSWVLLN